MVIRDASSKGLSATVMRRASGFFFYCLQWRVGRTRGLRKEDADLVSSALPKRLTGARRLVLKRFLLTERRELLEHFKALEGCQLAEKMLAESAQVVQGGAETPQPVVNEERVSSKQTTSKPNKQAIATIKIIVFIIRKSLCPGGRHFCSGLQTNRAGSSLL